MRREQKQKYQIEPQSFIAFLLRSQYTELTSHGIKISKQVNKNSSP